MYKSQTRSVEVDDVRWNLGRGERDMGAQCWPPISPFLFITEILWRTANTILLPPIPFSLEPINQRFNWLTWISALVMVHVMPCGWTILTPFSQPHLGPPVQPSPFHVTELQFTHRNASESSKFPINIYPCLPSDMEAGRRPCADAGG